MDTGRHELTDALISGTIAGVATALTATALGVKERSSPAQPLNATSHIVFGALALSLPLRGLIESARK